MIYLASPYTILNTDGLSDQALKNRRTRRFKQVCKKAAQLMLDGNEVFCPIAHSHPIETLGMTDIKDGNFWLEQDFAVLRHADELVVYRMPGWEQSNGIRREIAFADDHGIPISYVD